LILKAENAVRVQGTLQGQSTLRTLAWSNVGKSGDLGDRPGDKIKALSCGDWDPSSMFPLRMALMPSRFIFMLPPFCTVYKRSWGTLEPQVKSSVHSGRTPTTCLTLYYPVAPPPYPYLSLNLLDLFSLPCALLCAAPLPIARRPSPHCVLSPSQFAKGPKAKPLPPETIKLTILHRNNLPRN